MNKDDIISLPHQDLRKRSQRVGIVTPEVVKLINDMEAATLDWEDSREHEVGVALAAVQVDKLLRVIIVRNDFNDKKNREFTAFINPEITKLEGEIAEDFEGCLSIPDVYGRVKRHSKVRVKALSKYGKPVRLTAEGFLARIFQHEIDHCSGKLIIDHIADQTDAFFRLNKDGKLEPLDYDKDIKESATLWE